MLWSSLKSRVKDFIYPKTPELIDRKPLLLKLESLGFYKYTEPSDIHKAQADFLKNGKLDCRLTRRSYQADAEGVLEGAGQEIIEDVSLFLASQGFSISSVEQNYESGAYFYFITINGVEYTVYSDANEAEMERDYDFTLKQLIRLINDLLKQTSSTERAHLLYEWNDAMIIFLTPELYDAILESPQIEEYFKPKLIG